MWRALGVLGLVAACAKDTVVDSAPVEPVSPMGRLLIEELYYTGAPPAGGADHYFSDQFIELVNASDQPVMIGGLYLGDVFGVAGEINPGTTPDSQAGRDPDHVYLQNVWRIPGAPEDVVLAPGASALIAHDGVNHAPFSPVDLTGASWEAFVDRGHDEDSPLVDNLEEVHFTGGYDWLMTVFGPSVVVLELESEDALEPALRDGWRLRTAPVEAVVDAVETLMDADSAAFKRLPEAVDAGFLHASGTYTGESVRRVRADGVLQDTDDSSADFEVIATPEPGG
ncbi:MAG: DUF4876 domain-containing protein [Alphaproteobacteria bacterium]|nr:DUF4876 domain-containing protein [Alphaproteobacteria bacterium]